jgi:hypothetical protein
VNEPLCNLCGLTCLLGPPTLANGRKNEGHRASGLIAAEVRGGYESTPGNGSGALDDGTSYTFNICEFCLDWLFDKFIIPVTVVDSNGGESLDDRSAARRVLEDEWRKKSEFFVESNRRNARRRKA